MAAYPVEHINAMKGNATATHPLGGHSHKRPHPARSKTPAKARAVKQTHKLSVPCKTFQVTAGPPAVGDNCP